MANIRVNGGFVDFKLRGLFFLYRLGFFLFLYLCHSRWLMIVPFLDVFIRLGGYDLDRAFRRVYSFCCGKIRHPFFFPDFPPFLPFYLYFILSTRSECFCRIAELNTVIFIMVKFWKKDFSYFLLAFFKSVFLRMFLARFL